MKKAEERCWQNINLRYNYFATPSGRMSKGDEEALDMIEIHIDGCVVCQRLNEERMVMSVKDMTCDQIQVDIVLYESGWWDITPRYKDMVSHVFNCERCGKAMEKSLLADIVDKRRDVGEINEIEDDPEKTAELIKALVELDKEKGFLKNFRTTECLNFKKYSSFFNGKMSVDEETKVRLHINACQWCTEQMATKWAKRL